MKSKLLSIFLVALCCASSLTAFAKPQKMSNGEYFDAKFYATMYPDLYALYGLDEVALYNHYNLAGRIEGRLGYDVNRNALTTFNPEIPYDDFECMIYSTIALNSVKEAIVYLGEMNYQVSMEGMANIVNEGIDKFNNCRPSIELAIGLCSTNPKFADIQKYLIQLKNSIVFTKLSSWKDADNLDKFNASFRNIAASFKGATHYLIELSKIVPSTLD